MRGAHERGGRRDEHHDDDKLDRDDDVVEARGLPDADDEQGRNSRDHHHRRDIDQRAGHMPAAVGGIVGKRRSGKSRRDDDANIFEEAHHIARPPDGDGGGAERIFENQVPADDPGDEFAHRRVGIGVGAARDRHRRGHFRIAQTGKGAGERAEHKRQGDCRSGIGGGGVSGQDKNAGADDGADAERHKVDRRQRALERHAIVRGQRLYLRLRSFGLQRCDRFARPYPRHDVAPNKPTPTSATACRLATRSIEKCSIASLNKRWKFSSARKCRNTAPSPIAARSMKTNSRGTVTGPFFLSA